MLFIWLLLPAWALLLAGTDADAECDKFRADCAGMRAPGCLLFAGKCREATLARLLPALSGALRETMAGRPPDMLDAKYIQTPVVAGSWGCIQCGFESADEASKCGCPGCVPLEPADWPGKKICGVQTNQAIMLPATLAQYMKDYKDNTAMLEGLLEAWPAIERWGEEYLKVGHPEIPEGLARLKAQHQRALKSHESRATSLRSYSYIFNLRSQFSNERLNYMKGARTAYKELRAIFARITGVLAKQRMDFIQKDAVLMMEYRNSAVEVFDKIRSSSRRGG